jgi:hypothetical protein
MNRTITLWQLIKLLDLIFHFMEVELFQYVINTILLNTILLEFVYPRDHLK